MMKNKEQQILSVNFVSYSFFCLAIWKACKSPQAWSKIFLFDALATFKNRTTVPNSGSREHGRRKRRKKKFQMNRINFHVNKARYLLGKHERIWNGKKTKANRMLNCKVKIYSRDTEIVSKRKREKREKRESSAIEWSGVENFS